MAHVLTYCDVEPIRTGQQERGSENPNFHGEPGGTVGSCNQALGNLRPYVRARVVQRKFGGGEKERRANYINSSDLHHVRV